MTDGTIHHGELQCEDVRDLLAQHFAEMRADTPHDACHVMTADGLERTDISFLTLRGRDRSLLAVAALRMIETGHGEIKSMRVADDARGRGVGRAMLDAVVEHALAAGMRRLSLETGNSALFAPANALYEHAGFHRCGPFGDYKETDFTHFFTREI